jgi:hypothetical protein
VLPLGLAGVELDRAEGTLDLVDSDVAVAVGAPQERRAHQTGLYTAVCGYLPP